MLRTNQTYENFAKKCDFEKKIGTIWKLYTDEKST